MPCYDPPLTEEEEHNFDAWEYLDYVNKKLKLGLNINALEGSRTSTLCRILKNLDTKTFEKLVYNAHERKLRNLANWWEDHLTYDKIHRRKRK